MISIKNTKKQKISRLLDNTEHLSYNIVKKLLKNKDIKVNNQRVKEDIVLDIGDEVIVYYNASEKPLKTIFSDSNIVVMYKPKGINSLEFSKNVQKNYSSARLMHRLDTNTDGLLIFALNETSYNEIYNAFKDRTLEKKYKAIVYGKPSLVHSVLKAYYKKDNMTAKALISPIMRNGYVEIITEYTLISYDSEKNTSELEVQLHTGKTHQIRAHLSFMKLPIIGDSKYGNEEINRKLKVKKQQLTFYKLKFNFPPTSPLNYLNKHIITI